MSNVGNVIFNSNGVGVNILRSDGQVLLKEIIYNWTMNSGLTLPFNNQEIILYSKGKYLIIRAWPPVLTQNCVYLNNNVEDTTGWTISSSNLGASFCGYGDNNGFLIGGEKGLWYSDSGTSWSGVTLNVTYPSSGFRLFNYKQISFGNGKYIIITAGYNSGVSGEIYTSTNMKNFTYQQKLTGSTNGDWIINYLNNNFYILDRNEKLYYKSSDGINWLSYSLPFKAYDIGYGNGLYLTVGTSGSTEIMCKSTDFINWTVTNVPYHNEWIYFYIDRFFITIYYTYTSIDGISQTPNSPGFVQAAFVNNSLYYTDYTTTLVKNTYQ